MELHLFAALLTCLLGGVTSQEAVHYVILEELPVGSYIGNLITDANLAESYDSATLPQLRYRFLDLSDGEPIYFSIDDISGDITMDTLLDRDTMCPARMTCSIQRDAAAVSPQGHLQVITIQFEITDKNDNIPTFQTANGIYSLEIPESAHPGALYNLPLAHDPDSAVNSVQRYALSAPSDIFEVKMNYVDGQPKTVQLLLTSPLDREQMNRYNLVLLAFDGGDPPQSGSVTINVSIGDANDHGPVFVNNTYRITISEGTPIDTNVLTVRATDADIGVNGQVIYSFAASTDPVYLSTFAIDANNGVISLKDYVDYEQTSSYHIVVEAKDAGVNSQPGYTTVVINVEDTNDNAPFITINTLSGDARTEVAENAPRGRFIAHLSVRDPDGGSGGLFDCSISDSHFRLEPLQSTGYEIISADPFDREITHEYILQITCVDQGIPQLTSTADITITVTDKNDNAPEFDREMYIVELPENNHINKLLIKLNATDRDTGRNGQITYSLDPQSRNDFTIDSNTGIIRSLTLQDHETTQEVTLIVTARDNGDPQLSTTCTVIVFITDTNDESPEFTQPTYVFEVLENQPAGTPVGTVHAVDLDSSQYNQFEYNILQSQEWFTVDTHTGQVRTHMVLDRELQPTYIVIVVATNINTETPLSGTATIEVNVLDENDNGPVFIFPNDHNYTVQISNHIPIGDEVARVRARDSDIDENGRLFFSISGGNEDQTFAINRDTGVISTRKTLSDYGMKLFEMMILVRDNGEASHTAYGVIQIQVNHSISYSGGTQMGIITGSNVTIVIGLAVVSGIIMIILIAAIIFIKVRDWRIKNDRGQLYHCQVETALGGPLDITKDSSSVSDDSRSRLSYVPNDKIPSPMKHNHILPPSRHDSIRSVDRHSNNGKMPVGGRGHVDFALPQQMPGSQPGSRTASPHPLQFTGDAIDLNTNALVQKPWELSIKNLEYGKGQQGTEAGDDHDSDSAYSGDVSNTDSGRGLSEEGDPGQVPLSKSGSSNPAVSGRRQVKKQPFKPGPNGPHSRPIEMVSLPPQTSYPLQTFGPPRDSHGRPITGIAPPKHKQKPIEQMVANNNHNCLPKPGAYNKYLPSQHKNSRNYVDPHTWSKHGPHGGPLRPARSWDTLPEDDDGGSSTSGSYVVDPTDLYLEEGERLATAVNV